MWRVPMQMHGRVVGVSMIAKISTDTVYNVRHINTPAKAMKKYALSAPHSLVANRGQEAHEETCMEHLNK